MLDYSLNRLPTHPPARATLGISPRLCRSSIRVFVLASVFFALCLWLVQFVCQWVISSRQYVYVLAASVYATCVSCLRWSSIGGKNLAPAHTQSRPANTRRRLAEKRLKCNRYLSIFCFAFFCIAISVRICVCCIVFAARRLNLNLIYRPTAKPLSKSIAP